MLIKRPSDIQPSEITPYDIYRRRREFMATAGAVALAQALDRLPRELVLYGIAGDEFALGAEVSPPVRAAAAAVASRILSDWSPAHA